MGDNPKYGNPDQYLLLLDTLDITFLIYIVTRDLDRCGFVMVTT